MGSIADIVSKMNTVKHKAFSYEKILNDNPVEEVSFSLDMIPFDNPVEDLVRQAEHWKDFRGGRVFSVSFDAHEVVRSESDSLRKELASVPGGPSSAVDLESKVEAWLSQE